MDAAEGVNNASSAPISLDYVQMYIQTHVSNLADMLNEQYAKLADERKKLEREKEDFDATRRVVSSFKDPIKLNVGGTIFMTSKSTLSKQESMLSAMFSGRHELERGEDGAYFIDRDPKHFGRILNFLRDGDFEVPRNELEKKEMLREADYYSMSSLIEYLSEELPVDYEERILPEFDLRKGMNVIVNGATARNETGNWQSAFVGSISKGIHKCTFTWTGSYIMFGVAGANIERTAGNAHKQANSMMWFGHSGELFIAGSSKKTSRFGPGVLNVKIDCGKRTVTWLYGLTEITEPLHKNLQAPFSFCVDLSSSSVTITDIQ